MIPAKVPVALRKSGWVPLPFSLLGQCQVYMACSHFWLCSVEGSRHHTIISQQLFIYLWICLFIQCKGLLTLKKGLYIYIYLIISYYNLSNIMMMIIVVVVIDVKSLIHFEFLILCFSTTCMHIQYVAFLFFFLSNRFCY